MPYFVSQQQIFFSCGFWGGYKLIRSVHKIDTLCQTNAFFIMKGSLLIKQYHFLSFLYPHSLFFSLRYSVFVKLCPHTPFHHSVSVQSKYFNYVFVGCCLLVLSRQGKYAILLLNTVHAACNCQSASAKKIKMALKQELWTVEL